MLRILGRTRTACDGVSRRELLRVGGAGLLGVGASSVARAETAGLANHPSRARSVMFLYLFGGPSQLETFDMKPEAPSTVQGPFQSITARTPGLRICEHLPQLAACSDRYAVIRTLNHTQNDHNAAHIIQTGRHMPPAERGPARVNAAPNDWPSMGSVVRYLDRQRLGPGDVPSYIYLPNRHGEIQLDGRYNRLGQYAGWLGPEYNALATRIRKKGSGDNPYYRDCADSELGFQFPGLSLADGVSLDRLDRRRSLLDQFESQRRLLDGGGGGGYQRQRDRAFGMMRSTQLRDALDVRRESARLRDRYGRHLFGQSLMVGRRMVEAGARFVTVIWDMTSGAASGWDSHKGMTASLRDHLLPGLDQSVSALLEDLTDRGMLDETLVVCVGEMGRTPKFENRGYADGRDHWGYCFPALLAGAGVRGGLLHGRSDNIAGHPQDHPVSPADLSATIFDALGIDPHGTIDDKEGRPVPLVDGGEVVEALYA